MQLQDFMKNKKIDPKTIAEFNELLKEYQNEQTKRQREGIEQAKQRGVKFGRPRVSVENIEQLYQGYIESRLSLTEASQITGVSRSTLYRRFCERARIKR